jgi:hypothetical protein
LPRTRERERGTMLIACHHAHHRHPISPSASPSAQSLHLFVDSRSLLNIAFSRHSCIHRAVETPASEKGMFVAVLQSKLRVASQSSSTRFSVASEAMNRGFRVSGVGFRSKLSSSLCSVPDFLFACSL